MPIKFSGANAAKLPKGSLSPHDVQHSTKYPIAIYEHDNHDYQSNIRIERVGKRMCGARSLWL